MEITLTPEQEDFIQQMIQMKGFGSPEEVLKAAFLCLDGFFFDEEFKRKRLQEEIQEGLDQYERGEFRELDMDAIKKKAREKFGIGSQAA